MSSNLDAISESAMDEDLDADNTLLKVSSTHLSVPSADNNGNSSDGSHSSDNADSDSGEDDVDNTAGDNGEDGEDGNSSRDQDASDDSEDELDPTANKDDRSQDQGSKDRTSRPRVGVPSRKKRPSIGSLSAPPSNLIRIVSATPTKKIAKKSKKSVKPKSSKGSLSNAAARQATEEAKLEAAKPIVSRFLELENPKLNEKMLQVFMINGTNTTKNNVSISSLVDWISHHHVGDTNERPLLQ